MSTVAPMIVWMQTLSDPTRARILRLLERSELSVAEICTTLQLPQSTVSRHLKVLMDDGWTSARREGVSNWYRMANSEMDVTQKRLWGVAKGHSVTEATAEQDDARLEQVLDSRRSKSQTFFSTAAGRWDRLRGELFGHRLDAWAIAAALDSKVIVGDLGCGTGMISQTVAPWVEQVIAVDSSMAMLNAARKRLKDLNNVDLRRGELTELPLDRESLHVAILVLVLPYLPDPELVFSEAYRVTKRHGKLIVVDMVAHDRSSYREELGHTWLGFSSEQIEAWMESTRWKPDRHVVLPPETEAKGTQIFVASATKA